MARAVTSRLSTPSGSIAYIREGSGPPLLLVHGMGGDRSTWRYVLPRLAEHCTVIAPDLPGHGDSDAPAGDYSPAGQASALRDVVIGLGLERVSIAGHSLGGGVAMQFAYQFPERTERLVLISSGGLGSEVTPLLRAATLPGAEVIISGLARLPEAVSLPLLQTVSRAPNLLSREDARPLAETLQAMTSRRQRRTFVRTARTVLDLHGQALSAAGTLPAFADIPVLIAWGAKDRAIPPSHHRALARRLAHAHTLEIPEAGHFPQETTPSPLARAIIWFLAATTSHDYDEVRWRSRVVFGRPLDSAC
jgi:pimeloyl-ACP methyl ester carboxylesterase